MRTGARTTTDCAATAPAGASAATRVPMCVDRLFRRQVRRTPNAVAIDYRDRVWTYAELDCRAERLAARLRSLGVGRDVLVGLCLERSPEMVLGILGVMKAGGAYLPLDTTFPKQRLSVMLTDAQPPLVLTQTNLLKRLPKGRSRLLCLDRDVEDRQPAARNERPRGVRPDDLAYAIFTSGSTGRPKAVMITHRGLAHLALAQQEAFVITPQSRVLQFASLSFDASVSEIFVTLASGATLCLADPWQLNPGPELVRTLREMRITVVTMPPSILWMLGDVPLPDLATLVVAGERCSAELASRWSVGRRLINAYGPTEATVCASLYVCPEGPQREPPIGRGLPYCELLVLDKQLRPVPDGTVGELCIGGPGVARGYLNRPDLTAARFVPHPLAADPTARLYRTGDRVRTLPDGNLEFLGRADHQVKIRGVRIELDEIVSVLERHPGVAHAVVLCDESATGKRLVAFTAAHPERRPSSRELRNLLKRSLPSCMVPAVTVILRQLPLTDGGKIDRRALLALLPVSERGEVPAVPPRDALELELIHLWQGLLKRSPIGIRDDFFDIGGDSLRAMEVLAHIEREWGYCLSPSTLLAGPTIEQLAGALRHRTDRDGWSPIVPIQPHGSKRPFFCVHPGGGNALCYLDLARQLDKDQPLLALQAPGIDGVRSPLETVEAMAAEYLEAVRRIQPTGPYLVGGWSFGGIVAYEMACQLEDQSQEVGLLAILDAGILYAFAVIRTLFPDDDVPLLQMGAIDPAQQLKYFRQCSTQAQFIPPGAGEALARRILRIFQINVEATYNYRPRPYRGKIDLFLASEKFTCGRIHRDPYQEWADLCLSGVENHPVPGNHLTMIHQPHVQTLARRLQVCLDRAGRNRTRRAGRTAAAPTDQNRGSSD